MKIALNKYNIKTIAKFAVPFLCFILYLNSCSVNSNKKLIFYLTTLNSYGYILNKNDSLQIKKFEVDNKKFSDSCFQYKLNCIMDGGYYATKYKGGINEFRRTIFDNFRLPENTVSSQNEIYVLIGRDNKIKSYTIKNTKDYRVKKELDRILQLPEMNRWQSGSFNRYKLEYYVQLDLIIRNNF